MMGQLQRSNAYPQVNGAYPIPYRLAGVGAQTPNFGGIPNMNIGDYLSTFTPTTQTPQFSGMSGISPQQLSMASGIDLAPTLGNTGSFNWGGLDGSTTVGNPTGLTLGAGAGGGLPKIAMTDKINAGVGVFNAALGAISAYKALKLGKENLAFQKESFAKNFEASKNITNAQLENAQRVRVSADPTNAMSVADYMAKYGVK